MADCLECADGMSLEDILSKVTSCDESGNVSWNLFEVEDTEDCHSCTQFNSIEDLIRKSLYCDEDGVWYIRVTISS